ncbi:MAG: hypothetical protein V4501_05095 [Pseudomonadota bacterium]
MNLNTVVRIAGMVVLGAWVSTGNAATLLASHKVVPLQVVNLFFPEVTEQANIGKDTTAVGNPKATRSVSYANSDGSKKITISVDQYPHSSVAFSAYQEAMQKSKDVHGFKLIQIPKVGQRSFAGTVTKGAETHIGLGALDRKEIVGVTLAGYDNTPHNVAKLVALARKQEEAVRQQ